MRSKVKKTPMVGYLTLANNQRENEQTFKRGLRELGYIPGKNISIEWRFAGGKVDRVPELAAELVSRKTDVIVTGGGLECPLAVKNATTTIPIRSSPGSAWVISFLHPDWADRHHSLDLSLLIPMGWQVFKNWRVMQPCSIT